MAERKFLCINQVVKTVQIPLPASFISNEISGIAEILESWKCQFSKQLQGVVVNYKHFSLSSHTGFTAPNSPYVYYTINASFDLFCPKVGDIIKGKIFKIFKKHIVCLIEDTINVSIHLSSDSPKDLAPFICSDREILFEISSFSCGVKKALNVTGKITWKCIQLMKEFFRLQPFSSLVDTPEFSNNTDEEIGTTCESADNVLMDTSESSTADEMPKKKKRRKDKTVPLEEKEIKSEFSDVPDNETATAAVLSVKREISSPVKTDSDFVPESMMKKKSKDKKSKKDESKKKKGKITHKCIQLMKEFSPPLPFSSLVDTPEFSNNTDEEIGTTCESADNVLMDTSESSTADEMPKKKKRRKDKTVPLEEKEIKSEFPDVPDNETATAAVLSVKREISSPVKTDSDFVPESKMKKKRKDKKSKKDKSKKKKGKILASGAVLKKDKKSRKKGSKKIKLDGEQSKKHKKSKSHKKDRSNKKKKTESSKTQVSDVIKYEID